MLRYMLLAPLVFSVITISVTFVTADEFAKQWHQFRGPTGNGVAIDANPPIKWSPEDAKWKVKIPGLGVSTPIVWDDKIILLTAIKTDRVGEGVEADAAAAAESAPREAGQQQQREARQRQDRRPGEGQRQERQRGPDRRDAEAPMNYYEFTVICIDRTSGDTLWSTKVHEAVPHSSVHKTNTFASGSPTTDGKHIWASFNSYGLYCLDMEGNVKWERQLGKMQTRGNFGEGASPALYKDTLVLNWDHEGDSFIEAMDAMTGETKWRKDRDEATSWSTPLIVEYNDQIQVVTNGARRVRSYDLSTGDTIWECGGQTGNPIPTPMTFEDVAVCMTGFRTQAAMAIPLNSQGDVTGTDQVVWSRDDIGAYVPTGVLYKGSIYTTKLTSAVLVVIDAKTGETIVDQSRLNGIQSLYASLVAANDHIYVTGRDGTTLVLKHGDELDIVATNELDEPVDATPAIVGNQIFIRSHDHLYCFENTEE